MKAASETTKAISHGFAFGFHDECGLGRLAAALNEYGSHSWDMGD
jgi:hypothetical protein